MLVKRKLCYLTAMVIVPCQQAIADDSKTATESTKSVLKTATSGGTTASSTFGILAPAFQIETTSDDTNATLSLSFDLSAPDEPKSQPLEASTIGFATTKLNIAASAPLGKNGKPSLFDFDQLGDGTSLKIGFSHFWGNVNFVPQSDPSSYAARDERLASICVASARQKYIDSAAEPLKATAQIDAFQATIDAYQEENPKMSTQLATERASNSRVEAIKTVAVAMAKKCVDGYPDGELDGGPRSLLSEYGTKEDKSNAGKWDASGLWFAGVNAKISRASYSFIDQAAFAENELSRTSYKAEAFAGQIASGGAASYQVSLSYARSYKAQDEVQICQPNGVGLQISCIEGALGKPSRLQKYIGAIEYRRRFDISALGDASIAIAPRVSYDIKSNDALLDFPIFFAPDKGGKLNGGIRFGYDTGKDDFGFGLFVGVPFSTIF